MYSGLEAECSRAAQQVRMQYKRGLISMRLMRNYSIRKNFLQPGPEHLKDTMPRSGACCMLVVPIGSIFSSPAAVLWAALRDSGSETILLT